MVIDNHGQLDHAFFFEFKSTGKADDVAVFSRSRRQVQNKTRVQLLEHINTQFAFRVMAFIYNDYGIKLLENRHQGDFFISRFRKRQQVAVFLVGIAIVFVAAPQAIETENAKGQVFLYGRSVESRTL